MEYAPPGHGGPQPGAGRPAKDIDLDRIYYLLSIDCSEDEVAAAVGLRPSRLRERLTEAAAEAGETDYRRFCDAKRALGRARLRSRLDELAEAGPLAQSKGGLPALTANIWLSKQRLGYSDRSERAAAGTVNIQIICPDARTRELVEGIVGKAVKALPSPLKPEPPQLP